MKTYNSNELTEMFKVSPPRLLQFRKGQQVKDYFYDPILEEGKDWYWNGSEVVYTESAVQKLKDRRVNKKRNKHAIKQVVLESIKKVGEYTIQDVAMEVGLTVQKVYTLRDNSTNKPIAFTNYLIENTDWKYVGGSVIILESGKAKATEYAQFLEDRKKVPKSKRITVLIGTKVFNLTGKEARSIIEIIKRKQES
jgi:hypothetical protein